MLTLKAPIQLHIAQPLTVGADAFCERIRGNYDLLGAHFTPRDLLFLMTAPAELPEDLGGMTTLVNQQSRIDVRSISMDVVNNVVNRILLDGTERFTYQDQVYITTVLNRLGITNVAQFMEQVRSLRVENESAVHMTKLYRDEVERILERRMAGEETPALPLPSPGEDESALRAQDPRVTLSLAILNRLNTIGIYETVHAFQHSWTVGDTVVRNQELRLSEQLRFSSQIRLAELKQTLYRQPRLELLHHLNVYEAGIVLEPPRDEEAVLSQAAVAALLSAVDSTVVQVLSRPQYRPEQWISVQNALWQIAENSLSRFESYHTGPRTLLVREKESREAWHRYAQELREYQEVHRLLAPFSGEAETAAPSSAQAPPALSMVWNRTEEGDELDLRSYEQTQNETIHRLEQRIEAVQPPQAMRHGETLWQTFLHRKEQERKTQTLTLRETLTQTPSAPPELKMPSELVPPPAQAVTPWQSPPEVPLVPLTAEQAEEQAPEVLVRELERIDRSNRTILQSIQAREQKTTRPALAEPDLRQTMRTALRSLEEPESVLRELREAREQRQTELLHPALTPQEQELLDRARPQERALYEAVLEYRRDPQSAVAAGRIKPADPAVLHAALQAQMQAQEPLALEHAAKEETPPAEALWEQNRSAIERMIRPSLAQRTVLEEQSAPSAVRIVHKQASPEVTEELLEQLNEQHKSEIRKTESHEQVNRVESHQVDVNRIEKKVVAQTTEDITELVNRTLARQMRTISDQVYRQMEKRLQTERSRRGRL